MPSCGVDDFFLRIPSYTGSYVPNAPRSMELHVPYVDCAGTVTLQTRPDPIPTHTLGGFSCEDVKWPPRRVLFS
jgi:hypothetical protein